MSDACGVPYRRARDDASRAIADSHDDEQQRRRDGGAGADNGTSGVAQMIDDARFSDSGRSALQCDDFTRRIAKVELVVHRSHPSHALHGIDDIVELVAQRHSAQRHLIVVREYLDSLPMLDTMVQLRADARCELVVRSRFLFHPVFRTFLRAVPCISQKQRCPDPEARDQSDLFSAICWHWSLISLLVGGQLTGNASGGPLAST
jgi:hypothetical protein